MNAKDRRKAERFDALSSILSAQDRIGTTQQKLRAMANLIESADLECCGNGHPDGEANRCGLGCILHGLVDEYEMNIELLRADYDRSPEAIISDADRLRATIASGCYESVAQAAERINEMIQQLDGVTEAFGDEFPAAHHRKALLALKNQVSESLPGDDQKMRKTG